MSLPRYAPGFSLVFILSFVLLLVSCTDEDRQHEVPLPSVSVIEVGTQEVGEYAQFVARTEAYKTAELRARVEGIITKRFFREGDAVEKDQLLFEIDRDNYLAALDQAKANLSSAQADKDSAERNYKRGLELRPEGFISQSDMDTLTSNAAKARASVEAAKAALQNAEINLGYTRIKAPFEGRISTVNYNVGNLVGPGSGPLATLLKSDPIYVNFQMDENTYTSGLQKFIEKAEQEPDSKISPNELITLSLVLPTGTVHNYPGSLNYTGIEVNPTTGTVNLRAEFPNPTGLIRPGLYTTLILESSKKITRPMVPQYAVQEGQQGKFVLIIDSDNQVRTRNITIGRTIGPMWVVDSGLQAGDRLVVEGLQKVRTGTTVNPVIKYLDSKTGTLHESPEAAASTTTTSLPNPPLGDKSNDR